VNLTHSVCRTVTVDCVENVAHKRGYRHGAIAAALDVDVHEMAGRAGQGIVVAVKRDLVAHAGIAQLGHANAGVDGVREADRAEVSAARIDDEADDVALVDVEHATFDQELVHRRINIRVVHDIGDMPSLTHM
jgi:hypothetical protein